jgi:tetratricopeptide (TPR) repeat protein
LLQATNRLAEAEPLMRRALAIDEQSFGLEHPKVAVRLNNLATLLQATNRLAEAEPLMQRVIAIFEKSFGENHPNIAMSLSNLANLLQATNRLAEAEPLMRRALAIDEQSSDPEHPNVATSLNNLATLLRDTNRLAEAESLMWRVISIFEKSFGENHPNVATSLNNLAQLLKATNRLADAEPLMRRHLEIFLKFTGVTGHPHPHLQAATGNYAGLLRAMGRSEEDIQDALQALGGRFGVDLKRAGGQMGNEPPPKLRSVIGKLMGNPSKLPEIAGKLQREDPALFQELVQWLESRQVPSNEQPNPHGGSPAAAAMTKPHLEISIEELRESARANYGKGYWEAAATDLQKLLARGEPIEDIAPKIVTCLLNAHEDLLPHDAAAIEDLLRRLEFAGDTTLAADLRCQLEAKQPKPRKPWWKLW